MTSKDIEQVDEVLPAALDGFYSQSRDELEQYADYESAFRGANLSESELTFAGSAYVAVEKETLVNRPFKIRAWRFSRGDFSEFVIVFAVVHGTDENVLFTDGSTGIYRQLEKVTRDRLASDHPYPVEFLAIPNGLRVSEYAITKTGQPVKKGDPEAVGTGRTFYLA